MQEIIIKSGEEECIISLNDDNIDINFKNPIPNKVLEMSDDQKFIALIFQAVKNVFEC